MFLHSTKFCTFILLLMTYFSFTSAFNKRQQLNENDEPLPEEEKLKELFSTAESILEKMDEDAEELANVAEDIEKVEEKDGVTEADDVENKKILEEVEKELKETEKEEDLDENPEESDDVPTSTKTVLNENVEIPSSDIPKPATDTSYEKESGPADAFVVWDNNGKVCLLARMNVTFKIIYSSKGGEQKAEITVPKHATTKGKCESTSKTPLLQVSWQSYSFTIKFNKTDDDKWIITSVELTYDTSDNLFDGATNVGKKTARSQPLHLCETPLDKSYYCPGQEVILMYTGNKQVVTARMKDTHIQPYGIEDGQFSPAQRCSKVVLDGPDAAPYVQDETVPLAVGCTLALITLLILLGFSFHRAYNAAKVDYNTME